MTEIVLKEPMLVEAISQAAEKEGITNDAFVTDAVRYRLALYRQKRIGAESEAWYALPVPTRQSYAGKFVAVFAGKVVDSDSDRLALYQRMREQFGRQPVLIVEGGAQPMPVYLVRSPRRGKDPDAH